MLRARRPGLERGGSLRISSEGKARRLQWCSLRAPTQRVSPAPSPPPTLATRSNQLHFHENQSCHYPPPGAFPPAGLQPPAQGSKGEFPSGAFLLAQG